MANYGKVEYWEDRYQKDKEQFDWLQRYAAPSGTGEMRDIINKVLENPHVPNTQLYLAQILIIGCGTSRLAEEMCEDGYSNLTSIDISYSAIKICQDEYKERYPNLQFKQMDVRNLGFKDGSFDVVIDKGLMDAMACGDGAMGNVQNMLSEIHRVLTPTGTYICISHGVPSQRKKYLKNVSKFNWSRAKHIVQKPQIGQNYKEIDTKKKKYDYDDKDTKKNFHYVYVCKKLVKAVIDSSDEEAVLAEKMRIENEKLEKQAADDEAKAAEVAQKEAEAEAKKAAKEGAGK